MYTSIHIFVTTQFCTYLFVRPNQHRFDFRRKWPWRLEPPWELGGREAQICSGKPWVSRKENAGRHSPCDTPSLFPCRLFCPESNLRSRPIAWVWGHQMQPGMLKVANRMAKWTTLTWVKQTKFSHKYGQKKHNWQWKGRGFLQKRNSLTCTRRACRTKPQRHPVRIIRPHK